jgi:hypothetical protein
MDFDSWIDKPLDQVINEAKNFLLSNKHLSPDHVECLVNSLLTSVSVRGEESDVNDVKQVADLVLEIGILQAYAVGPAVLHQLSSLPQPVPFVEIIPALYGMSSPLQLQEVFEQLQSLLSTDNQYILPVINSLVDLPLSAELKTKLVFLTEEVISIVDETDIPFLFRTLLNNLEHINTNSLAGKILTEVRVTVLLSICLACCCPMVYLHALYHTS